MKGPFPEPARYGDRVCFSPEGDLVGGIVVGAVGVDALRHLRGRRTHLLLGTLPLLLGVHQLDESVVWLALQGHLPSSAGRVAMWIYLVIALVVVPVFVPVAILRLEPSRSGRWRIAPFVALFIAAPLLRLFSRSRPAGLAALAVLAALTMTPAGALLPRGVFPAAARPHAPRADMAELRRMKDWVDARATPSRKICGLGSSYTFSGQLIGELWQLKADKSPLSASKAAQTSVAMTDIDTVDGPPNPAMKDCAVMIVGDPVQTHVIPSFQLTVTVPSREMLEGVGFGAHYARTGEVFHLQHGVGAVVFEQTSPVSDADMAALAGRWRAARAEVERGSGL